MKILRRQRGQTVVEFALVFPFFAMMILAMVYFGFLTADYVTLNSAASNAAREVAVGGGVVDTAAKAKEINNKIGELNLFMNRTGDDNKWYVFDSNVNVANNSVTVEITASLTDKIKDNVVLNKFLPETYTISQSMYYNG